MNISMLLFTMDHAGSVHLWIIQLTSLTLGMPNPETVTLC